MPAAAAPGQVPDPFRQYLFKVDIDPATRGHFHHCEGLAVNVDVVEYREGGNAEIVRKLPGQVAYPPVRLKFGVIHGDFEAVWTWIMSAVGGVPTRKNVALILMDTSGQEKMRWSLNGCWPCSWEGGKLDALGRGVLTHELVLAYDELKRESQPPGK